MHDGQIIVSAHRLKRLISEVLVANGATEMDAANQAELLVEGDLRNQPSHGVQRLSTLVARLKNGLIVSGTTPQLSWLTDAVLAIDGNRGFGPSVAFAATDAIVERADHTGIAIAAVKNSNHVGMLAPYIERIAAHNQIGIALTTSEALVHPWGGNRAMVGTNPVGIAIPTPSMPLVVDMSTAAVSMGKILNYAANSMQIPLGWAVDRNGEPTTEPAEAASGAISPFGGPKGYGLGLAFEAMVAMLTGSGLGRDVKGTLDSEHVANKGDLFMAISLDRLGLTSFLPFLETYFDDIRGSGHASSVNIPGDRARRTRTERLASGIPVNDGTWTALVELHGGDY